MKPLFLASTSPWRAELLARLGLPFQAVDSGLDEEPFKRRGLSGRSLTETLARAKAAATAAGLQDGLVIGADQVASLDGVLLGKPGTPERAVAQLLRLGGRTHELITGVAVHDAASGEVRSGVDVQRITFRDLPREAVERYVSREDVLGCAGSYRVEGLGIALFSSVEGTDPTGIIGLPLMLTTRLLVEAGLDPLS